MTALLATRRLGVSIAGIEICSDLNIIVEPGSRWAILGRNGSGKTTLLKTLAGLHAPDSGEVAIEGLCLDRMPRRRLARSLGFLFQEQAMLFPGTVLDTALIGRHPYLDEWRWETAEDIACARAALARVGLAGKENRQLSTLSGGECQRLAIATLLTQDPMIYLLDEPSTHLDLYHQIHVLRILCDLAREGRKTLIMVLHDVNLAARFCDHALLLFGGGALLHGAAASVLTEENLARLYGHPVLRFETEKGAIFSPAWD